MTPTELAEFKRLLPLYLELTCREIAQAARTREYHQGERELSERDCQAMYNFSAEGISSETIAQHFHCSIAYVQEMITKRPWLRPQAAHTKGGNLSWWESDHSDPLELVKLFYPQYLPQDAPSEISAKECKQKMTAEEFWHTIDWTEAYKCYGDNAGDVMVEEYMKLRSQERNRAS